jgi:hypothetical protein
MLWDLFRKAMLQIFLFDFEYRRNIQLTRGSSIVWKYSEVHINGTERLYEAFTGLPLQDICNAIWETFMIFLCGCFHLTSKFLGFTHLIFDDLENIIVAGQAMIEWLKWIKHTAPTKTHRVRFRAVHVSIRAERSGSGPFFLRMFRFTCSNKGHVSHPIRSVSFRRCSVITHLSPSSSQSYHVVAR